MRKPSNWDTAQAKEKGGKLALTAGGHGCVIINARTVKEMWSGVPEEKLYLEIDIDEGSEFDGYYADRLEFKRRWDDNAKWPGWYKTSIYAKDGSDDTDSRFKGLIRAIEKSNPGFTFEFNESSEASLVGKRVGFVFRDEPFVARDSGQVIHYVRAAWPCCYDIAHDEPEPEPKAVRGESTERPVAAAPVIDTSKLAQVDDDELPF